MRILTLFIDMIRPNRLKIFNKNISKKTDLDLFLLKLGGDIYGNVIVPGPDTPRSASTFFTGLAPWVNGCKNRYMWPREFLKDDLETNDKIFENSGYEQYFFSNPNEREAGLFPKSCYKYFHNEDIKLKNFLQRINPSENSHLFISLPDFHLVFDDLGCNKFTENIGYKNVVKSLEMIFKYFSPDFFDDIIIFSDHGFKFSQEVRKEKRVNPLLIYNEDRIKGLFVHRRKGQRNINHINKLISIGDIREIYKIKLRNEKAKIKFPLRDYIVFEDHINFTSTYLEQTEIFGLVNNDLIYIRDFDKALTLNRSGEFISNEISDRYDEILLRETTFGEKFPLVKRMQMHREELYPNKFYTNGDLRIKLFKGLAIILKKLKNFF